MPLPKNICKLYAKIMHFVQNFHLAIKCLEYLNPPLITVTLKNGPIPYSLRDVTKKPETNK